MLSAPRTPLPMMRMLGRKEHWRYTRTLALPAHDFALYHGFPPRSSFRPTNDSMMAEHTAHLRRAAAFPRINVTSTPTPSSNPINDLSAMYATLHKCPSSIISLGVSSALVSVRHVLWCIKRGIARYIGPFFHILRQAIDVLFLPSRSTTFWYLVNQDSGDDPSLGEWVLVHDRVCDCGAIQRRSS